MGDLTRRLAAVTLFTLALVHAGPAWAKCAHLTLRVDGILSSPLPSGAEIAAFVEPHTQARGGRVEIEGNRVRGVFGYDTWVPIFAAASDVCSLEPAKVGLRVTNSKSELFSATKQFPGDFVETRKGVWTAKEPVMIDWRRKATTKPASAQ